MSRMAIERWLASAALLVACSGTESTNPPGEETDAGRDGGGPVGAVGCYTDEDCEVTCSGFIEGLDAPTRPLEVVSAACTMTSFVPSPPAASCDCAVEGGGSVPLSSGYPDACLRYGRDRSCIYRRDEFPGCDVDDPTSCDAACADLEDRMRADAERVYDAEVRYAACRDYDCDCILRMSDGCYVQWDIHRYDCALSNAEMLADFSRRHGQPFPSCETERDSDASVGTCVEE